MRSKIKNTLPLFLAGLLLLAACAPEETPADNRIYLDIEQPGSNGSKVALDGNSTYWMDDDTILLAWGDGWSLDDYAGEFSVKYSSEREAYLCRMDNTQTPFTFPSNTDYLFACYPHNLVEKWNTFATGFTHLDEGAEYNGIYYDPGTYVLASVTFPAKQTRRAKISVESNVIYRQYSSESIPMVSMIPNSQNRLYMRHIGSVIDVQLTNGFSNANANLQIDSIVVTSNVNITGLRYLLIYLGGAEAPKPRCTPQSFYSSNDRFKKVILRHTGRNLSNISLITPGNTLSYPIALAPTDCLPNIGDLLPELTFEVYGYINDGTPIHYTRTASLTQHLPDGAYFTAPITLDENNTGSSSIELLEDGDPIWSY